jgi:hypothetical protein
MVNPATADLHILTWRWKFCRGPGGRTVGFAACNMRPARPWCDERPSTLDNQVLSSEISLACNCCLPCSRASASTSFRTSSCRTWATPSASSRASRRGRVRSMPANLWRRSVRRSPGPASYASGRQRKPLIRSATILRLSSVASSGGALHSMAMARSSSSAP